MVTVRIITPQRQSLDLFEAKHQDSLPWRHSLGKTIISSCLIFMRFVPSPQTPLVLCRLLLVTLEMSFFSDSLFYCKTQYLRHAYKSPLGKALPNEGKDSVPQIPIHSSPEPWFLCAFLLLTQPRLKYVIRNSLTLVSSSIALDNSCESPTTLWILRNPSALFLPINISETSQVKRTTHGQRWRSLSQ